MARVVLLLVLIAAGCTPTIHYFRAQPNIVCAGTPSRLSWSASTAGRITNVETGDVVERVAKTGSTLVSPSQRTTYRLSAHSPFGTTKRDIDVGVIVTDAARDIGVSMANPSASCDDKSWSAVIHADPAAWDPHIVTNSIHALGHRPLHIEHDGISADVAADGDSDAFRGLRVRGDWSIASPLLPDERCGIAGPANLAVRIIPSCAP